MVILLIKHYYDLPLYCLLMGCLQNPWVVSVGYKFQVSLIIEEIMFLKEDVSEF